MQNLKRGTTRAMKTSGLESKAQGTPMYIALASQHFEPQRSYLSSALPSAPFLVLPLAGHDVNLAFYLSDTRIPRNFRGLCKDGLLKFRFGCTVSKSSSTTRSQNGPSHVLRPSLQDLRTKEGSTGVIHSTCRSMRHAYFCKLACGDDSLMSLSVVFEPQSGKCRQLLSFTKVFELLWCF
jgi:hypothetical protein